MEDELLLHMLSERFKDLPLPKDYAEFDAGEFVVQARRGHKSAEGLFINCLLYARQDAPNQNEIQEYADLVRRYIVLLEAMEDGRQIDLHDARLITDFWTDTKIFDAASHIERDVLRIILEFWRADKEGGFYDIPEPQRAAAQAGNYGAYISRLIEQPQRKANKQSQEQIKTYLCTTASVKIEEYAEALRRMTGITAAAELLKLWKNPKRVRAVYERGKYKPLIEFAPWVRLWNEAFALDIPEYKPSQIKKYNQEK